MGEIWILGESLNGSLRERAAHFSGRDVPTEVGSRNRFLLPGSETGRAGLSREKAQDTQKRREPCTANFFPSESVGRGFEMTSAFWDPSSFSFLRILCLLAATQLPLSCSLHTERRNETGFSRQKAQDTQKRGEPCTANLFPSKSVGRSVGMTSTFWDPSPFSFLRILCLFAAKAGPCGSLVVAGVVFCSVGRIGPSPPHLFESATLHSHPL